MSEGISNFSQQLRTLIPIVFVFPEQPLEIVPFRKNDIKQIRRISEIYQVARCSTAKRAFLPFLRL